MKQETISTRGDGDTGFRHVVVIGASAGGVETLCDLVPLIPPTLAAPVVIALHTRPPSRLGQILQREARAPVVTVTESLSMRPGHIYAFTAESQPFFHGNRIMLEEYGDRRGFRPSIDVLFASLADVYGEHGIGVVLSGTMHDGTLGAQILDTVDAKMLVQSPDEALFSAMPENVIRDDHPDAILSIDRIAERLIELAGETTPARVNV